MVLDGKVSVQKTNINYQFLQNDLAKAIQWLNENLAKLISKNLPLKSQDPATSLN